MLPQWLVTLFMFASSLLFFGKIYRIALTWFVRGRINRSWEVRAELVTIAASVPFGAVCGLLSIEATLLLARLAIETNLPFTLLPTYVLFLEGWKLWLAGGVALLFLARMVPQTIAGSKVYAYGIEDKYHSKI